MSRHVDDFNNRNKVLTELIFKQDIIKFVRRFSAFFGGGGQFYRRHFDIVSKYNVELKILVLQGLSEPEFNGDFVTKCLRNQGRNNGECWSTAN